MATKTKTVRCNGILNFNAASIYDDRLPIEYGFAERHRSRISKCLGQRVIFYETGCDGGRKGYFAEATVSKIRAGSEPGHYFVVLEGYRPFSQLVPHKVDGMCVEPEAVSKNGRFNPQLSIRHASDATFDRILALGGLH